MNQVTKFLVISAALFSMTGCLKTAVNFAPTSEIAPNYQQRQTFFLYGITPSEVTVNASEACTGGNIAKIETRTTFVDGLLGGLTFGIYYPKTLRIWCKNS
jgi:hypothetical protein